MTTPFRDALRTRLTAALRERDRPVASALRTVLAALDNAEAVVVADDGRLQVTSEHVAGAASGLGAAEAQRRDLSDGEERALATAEVAEIRARALACEAAARHEEAVDLRRAADVVAGLL